MDCKKYIRLEVIAVIVAAAILVCILMVKPIVGVADNGDFGRIMGSTGLQHLTDNDRDRYFGYINREYRMTLPGLFGGGYFSSQILMVLLARCISVLVLPDRELLDIRFLAMIYCMIFLAALYLLIKYLKRGRPVADFLIAALAVFLFTDVGYTSYFNSLYGEALSLVSLLLVIGTAVLLTKQEQPSIPALVGFFSAAVFLTAAKAQNAPIGLMLALFGFGLLRLRKDKAWKRVTVFFSLLLVSTMVVSYASVPDSIRVCNKYQSIFFGVLKDSPAPEDDLRKLGMEEDLAVLAGTNYFMQEYPLDIKAPEISEEISRKVSPFKVAMFYLKHPSRFLQKLEIAAGNGFKLIQGFGNYEKEEGVAYKKTAESFRLWSDFKQEILPHSLVFVAVYFGGYLFLLIFIYIRKKNLRDKLLLEVFLLIGVIGAMQFIIPIIGDGEADLSKHLFLFNVCFDAVFIFYGFCLLQGLSATAGKVVRVLSTRLKKSVVNE